VSPSKSLMTHIRGVSGSAVKVFLSLLIVIVYEAIALIIAVINVLNYADFKQQMQ
jgi:hypothetical protein